ncbi:large conductance mechanosensitive channel protein MscL [Vagococcus elongatus]|uniref:Large-conductance mechanosensitive channel n=1 Tax=Vagococcus elongatus TaxID=180344 RepID=A0A430B143_9ENTE|nr:large conductance mechanosensitive channel protein MscL [Vagococcus elongatus]RSU14063.1 hypothetical protein CBF29_04045 [Vagococcus elongatus]
MLKEFKEFIIRGSAFELAIGVVIGGAFNSVVSAIVDGILTPIVSWFIMLVTGNPEGKIDGLTITLAKGASLNFGLIISAIISFLITMLVLFFIVKGVNKARSLGAKTKEEEAVESEPTQEDYLKEIVELLKEKN